MAVSGGIVQNDKHANPDIASWSKSGSVTTMPTAMKRCAKKQPLEVTPSG